MQKDKRQDTILEIIELKRINRQEELVNELETHGYKVTQASVSRDLEELGVVKTNGYYKQMTIQPEGYTFGLSSLESAGPHMLVAKCSPGLASALAVRIDSAKFGEIVGTLAGDDTIFIANRDERSQKALVRQIWRLVEDRP